jgi:hypothetical protein
MTPLLLHMKYQINNAPLRQWPFPHLLIDEILPPAFYDEMIRHMPNGAAFDKNEFGGKRSEERHRTIIRLTPDVTNDRMQDWMNEKMDWFTGGELSGILLDRFRTMPSRPEDATPGHLSLILNDQPGYAIGPHMDIGAKIVTMIIYTPRRRYEQAQVDSLGTSLYQPKSGWTGADRGRHYHFDTFDRIITVPYKPNTALLFHSIDGSFHGVEPTVSDRMTLQYQVVDANTTFAQSRGVSHGTKTKAEAEQAPAGVLNESSR